MLRLNVARIIGIFGLITIVGFLATTVTQYMAISHLKVGGSVYDRIVLGKDLVADILPPPEYVIEAYLEATLTLNDPKDLDVHSKRLAQLRRDYDDRHAYWMGQDFDPDIKTMLTEESDAAVGSFWQELDQQFLPAVKAGNAAAARASYAKLTEAYLTHRGVIDRIVTATNEMNAKTEAEANASETGYMTIVWAVAGLVLAFIAAGIVGIVVTVVRPLVKMTEAMRVISEGNFTIAIPSADRKDEIGSMAAALDVFRKNGQEAERLRAAQEQERQAAEIEKNQALQSMAETVEQETRSAVDSISNLTDKMAENARHMVASAENVSSNSQSVSAAATQALASVQTVALATEELSNSISEISTQVNSARAAAEGAVSAATTAETSIGELQSAVMRIDEVTRLISEIASQTNLLALNATIEAARAGEAGKGFAVVASEVKNLATQTAKATGEITQQIGAVQTATARAVEVVQDIGVSIRGVETMSTAVAAAIEEQTATTAEIARSVTETSVAAQEVAERIANVSQEADISRAKAGEVNDVSGLVATGIDQLRQVLVRVVRTSTKEVDRRRKPRYNLDRSGALTVGGTTHKAKVVNCSEGGALLSVIDPLPNVSGIATLSIDRLDPPMQVRVLSAKDSRLHVKFVEGSETQAFIEQFRREVAHLAPLKQVA
jgi:methyl-accepting chemotaxis protein